MDKYSLEVQTWGEWELERDFSSPARARRHGEANFPQNEWRVIDRRTGAVVHVSDPAASIEAEARAERQRFADAARFQQQMTARASARRLSNVAAIQRQAERARRLSGFRFDGPNYPTVREVFGGDLPKADWKKEGF